LKGLEKERREEQLGRLRRWSKGELTKGVYLLGIVMGSSICLYPDLYADVLIPAT
jgi:hypothetical protein